MPSGKEKSDVCRNRRKKAHFRAFYCCMHNVHRCFFRLFDAHLFYWGNKNTSTAPYTLQQEPA
jgi:hypothetical protein